MTAKKIADMFKSCITILLIQVVFTECKFYVPAQQKTFYKKYSDGLSNNKIIGIFQTTTRKCAQLCAKNPQCVGFNIGPLNIGKNMVKDCNLTKATYSRSDTGFTRAGFGYYEILNCDMMSKGSMPCPRGFICCPDTKPQICPPNKRGTNCSKTCSSYVIPHRDLTFGQNLAKLSYINNVLQCWERCWALETCLSFTYVAFYSECYLKDLNDVTSPDHLTSLMPFDTNLYVFDCKPYDRDVPYD